LLSGLLLVVDFDLVRSVILKSRELHCIGFRYRTPVALNIIIVTVEEYIIHHQSNRSSTIEAEKEKSMATLTLGLNVRKECL
jgi:hypothetical protein